MTEAPEVLDWLKVALAPRLGAGRLEQLGLEPERIPELSRMGAAELRHLGLHQDTIRALAEPDSERLDACLDWLDHPRHHLITRADPLYPPLLARISDPPPVLYVNGDPARLVQPQVAIVGSRNATSGGVRTAAEFAERLASAGVLVTSGLALGIDASAHRAALDAGGVTIAVAGTGPDQVYPACHRDLARQIVDNGAVMSAFAPGMGPRPGHFPARNRLISGMSVGVVVVEAGVRSGSLITARLAGEQGREVFAVPGSIRNPQSRGCHRLIRQGARLVESADELLEDIAPLVRELAGELRLRLSDDRDPANAGDADSAAADSAEIRRILDAIGHDPVAIDDIITHSGMSARTVSALLLELELDGRLTALDGGRYCRA